MSATKLAAAPSRDAAVSSGPSPTIHLIGAGKVGRALLRRLPGLPFRLVAVSDRSGSVLAREGLDALALASWKDDGRPFARHELGAGLALEAALALSGPDVVIDCSASELEPAARASAAQRTLSLLRQGVRVLLAAKTPLLAAPQRLLARRELLGVNAALGGTGGALLREIDELQAGAISIACVPNATTTTIVAAIERGGSLDDGIDRARAIGLLEHDAAQDLDGRDAALKLALAARLVFGSEIEPESVARTGIAALDPRLLRERRARGATTRLVGRATRHGPLSLAWEELPPGSPLAVPPERVAYCYGFSGGHARVHVGAGVGPEGTADALIEDLLAACAGAKREAA